MMERPGMKSRAPRIIISNCWSYYNKGDAAIVLGAISLVKRAFPDAQIILLAFHDKDFQNHVKDFGDDVVFYPMPSLIPPLDNFSTLLYGVNYVAPFLTELAGICFVFFQLFIFNLLRPFMSKLDKVLNAIDDADLFLAVGGNYLYSHEGLYNHLIPILYAKIIKKKPVVLFSHSIGPFNKSFIRKIILYLFEKIDYIYLREELSENYLKNELKLQSTNLKTISDLSFILKEGDDRSVVEYKKKINNVGISVRNWLFNEPNLFNNYINSMIKLCSSLISEGYNVIIIPFSYTNGKENDVDLSNKIFDNIENKSKVTLLNIKEHSIKNVLKVFKDHNIDVMIGTRLHSIILASLFNIPSIIISYQYFKSVGISKQLSLSDYVVDINKVSYDTLYSKFLNIVNNYENEQKNISNSIDDMCISIIEEIPPRLKSLLKTKHY